MPSPVVNISLDSPFTLRDLSMFLDDARNNGINFSEPVTTSLIFRGEYDHQITDSFGRPEKIQYVGLSVTIEED